MRPKDAPATTRDFERCLVTLDIDREGHPTARDKVEGCPEPFAAAATEAFVQWRFEPCVYEKRQYEGAITLEAVFASSVFQAQPKYAYDAVMALHQPIPAADDTCLLEVWVKPDGTISRLTSNHPTYCLAALGRMPVQRTLGVEKATRCHVTLEVRNSKPDPDSVQVTGCDDAVAQYVRTAATSSAWNSPIGGSEIYKVVFTVGPEQ